MSQTENARTLKIELPELSVVALVGASGSGKSTFAKRYFKPTEILSSDFFRGLVSDDENNQRVSGSAFESLFYVANKRLDIGRLTVIDATNVQKEARAEIIRLAREQNCLPVAIVLNMPEKLCAERNARRADRNFGEHVIKRQSDQLRRSIRHLEKEGFRYVYVVNSEAEANTVEIIRKPLWNNKKEETGPFDIIGDVHGCFDELCALLEKLGYALNREAFSAVPPRGRKAVFLGDLCDRGPENVKVLRLVMNMVKAGDAHAVIGNHDFKLFKYLKGAKVTPSHGLDATIAELAAEPEAFRAEVKAFLDALISHYVFDHGKLVVAHAGLKEKLQGRGSGRVREFCMFGETNGETDEYGLPVRMQWASDYRGEALVVYGHTPNPDVQSVNNTVCVDTGCVFGGKLTAYRYPERESVQVDALREYYKSVKPLHPQGFQDDDLLNIDDVLHQRYLSTRLKQNIKIHEENAFAALEVMSRFAIDPHWLIYLPPTMSPCETSPLADYLEYPLEAFDYYKTRGIARVVCEQKHMGSRAVIILCRDAATAKARFKTGDDKSGVIYTRTGRSFFNDEATEARILERLNVVLTHSGFWTAHHTDWVCLDVELMPWSVKAQTLLVDQYAAVGRAGRTALAYAHTELARAVERMADAKTQAAQAPGQSSQNADLTALLNACAARQETLARYTDAYRRYCWEVNAIDDYRIAPFHLLATEGRVWNSENHVTHLETIKQYMTGRDAIFVETPYRVVDTLDENSVTAGAAWWEELTASGGEGMVVKPYDFIAMKGNETLQPGIKCRGREYLHIIYGPEYTLNNHLERLKKRGLGKKRALALNEFALGMEALERFARKEPLYRVHECVFGILALESEP
ncbi:MAG: polynucleotide kinase-phosphatase, partial [Zoogloeaceae bacterium]|nr:polynucleotide kinase-phosphatase [Zoogloeaceae bacterium]